MEVSREKKNKLKKKSDGNIILQFLIKTMIPRFIYHPMTKQSTNLFPGKRELEKSKTSRYITENQSKYKQQNRHSLSHIFKPLTQAYLDNQKRPSNLFFFFSLQVRPNPDSRVIAPTIQ